MVKCPKCGAKGWFHYYNIATLDTDYNDNEMIQINKVKCTECEHEYTIKEFYAIEFETSCNID